MDDRAGIWKAILSEPDEDAHRLVFADWLDEQGEPDRAEFVRAQCESADHVVDDARRIGLELRVTELLQRHRDSWLGGLAKWIDRGYVTFRRGFPWSVDATRNTFLRNASALASRTVVQEAAFDSVGSAEGSLAGLPIAARLRSIRSHSQSFVELRDVLTACTGLTALALFGTCDGGDVGRRFPELLALPSVRGVDRFTLRSWDSDREAVEAVAEAEFANLRTVGLELRSLGHETLDSLLRAPFVRGLKTLSLQPHLDAAALRMLGGTAALAGLRSLRLYLAEGAGEAFGELAGSPYLAGLTELCIGGHEPDCATALDSELPRRLRSLELSSWNRSERRQVFQSLADSGRLRGLMRLRAYDSNLTDADVSALAACPHLPSLMHLDLDERELTDRSLEALARSPHFPALRAVTAVPNLMSVRGIDADALRALRERFDGRFALLVSTDCGWTSSSPKDMRLGAY